MLFRFSLYGFLKNQRYFEPFLVLAFLEKGLSFFEVGLLIAMREFTTNLLEIPSGAFADVVGRRAALIASFVAYVASYLVFGWTESIVWLIPAMLLFSVGDSFRSGTHKALIFAWLRQQGRTEEKTRVYGFTRSWSKLGSAVSVVVGALIVFAVGGYSAVFVCAAVPSAMNIVNFLGYPASLEENVALPKDGIRPSRLRTVWSHTWSSLGDVVRRPALRRLVQESTAFEGLFGAVKDYLQPVLAAVASASLARALDGDGLSEAQRTALLVGPVYFVLHLASSIASRRAHRLSSAAGGDVAAARILWAIAFAAFLALTVFEWTHVLAGSVAVFVLLHVLQNFWRPILISRFDDVTDSARGATVLSIESQARRLGTAIAAPLLGLAVDASSRGVDGDPALWPIAITGVVVTGWGLATSRTAGGERAE